MQIFDVLGPPSELEMACFADDPRAARDLRSSAAAHINAAAAQVAFGNRNSGQQRAGRDLESIFAPAWCEPAAAALLQSMLRFCPKQRATAAEVLQSAVMREEAVWWAQENAGGLPLPHREASRRRRRRAAQAEFEVGPRGARSQQDLGSRIQAQVSAWRGRHPHSSSPPEGQGQAVM
jgi:hypothetical protein